MTSKETNISLTYQFNEKIKTMRYSIEIKAHKQDVVNFIDFKAGDEMPEFLIYEEVLNFSIRNHYIKNESEIKSLCDGSNHIEPYFSDESAAYNCQATLLAEEGAPKFKEDVTYYELF